jgi:hypothetical protein
LEISVRRLIQLLSYATLTALMKHDNKRAPTGTLVDGNIYLRSYLGAIADEYELFGLLDLIRNRARDWVEMAKFGQVCCSVLSYSASKSRIWLTA